MKFKYAIGEIVQLKLTPNVRIFILERHLVECSGGVQISYYGRAGSDYSGLSNPAHFKEIELEKDKSKAGGTE